MKHIAFAIIALSITIAVTGCHKNVDNPSPEPATENAVAAKQIEDFTNRKPFKYTITTDIDGDKENVEINVVMNLLNGQAKARYDLDCNGDGEYEFVGLTNNQKCIYPRNSGTHQIWIRGEIPAMFLCTRNYVEDESLDDGKNDSISEEIDDSKISIISIDDWGDIEWMSMHAFAKECEKLNHIPEQAPNLSKVTDMSGMFRGATSFNQPLDNWDTANVKKLSWMFYKAAAFNQPLENWNTSNVTDMSGMFGDANAFNQPLEKWDTANVTDMSGMFYAATSFNQPLEKWNTSNVNKMNSMFTEATAFNQPLENWNTSNVTEMNVMFWGATSFNQPLGNWDTKNVAEMNGMFSNATSFNQPLEKWNTANVKDMSLMFNSATSFDQPLEMWNITKVCNMDFMFKDASNFNHYPMSWIVPSSKEMFVGTKVEQLSAEKPLKIVEKDACRK